MKNFPDNLIKRLVDLYLNFFTCPEIIRIILESIVKNCNPIAEIHLENGFVSNFTNGSEFEVGYEGYTVELHTLLGLEEILLFLLSNGFCTSTMESCTRVTLEEKKKCLHGQGR